MHLRGRGLAAAKAAMRQPLRRMASLSLNNINQQVLTAEYAVRGPIVLRSAQIKAQLASDPSSLPFDNVLACNIGNPQAVGQQPISFNRQVHALMTCPDLLASPEAAKIFPADAIARAKEYLTSVPEGVGAYSESQGFAIVRQQVADFIAERDGVPANPKDIFLTDGASKGVEFILKLMLRGSSDGVLVPIPQYPLYSAALALADSHMLGYELDEADAWALPMEQVEKAVAGAKAKGVQPRALVVINPGNPTGNSLLRPNMEEIVRFCAKEKLVLIADEVWTATRETQPTGDCRHGHHAPLTASFPPQVYQENIWDEGRPFISFKEVVSTTKDAPPVELVSLHSVSKGFLGECGIRGGYFELAGFDPEVQAQLLKLVSIGLCSNTMGQIAVGLMVRPPKPGEPSEPLYAQERGAILSSMKRRAAAVAASLNALEGVSCNAPQGAMYAFPSITLPPKAVAAAEAEGMAPDAYYAMHLLENTGIVVVPGSGFGQKAGTWHFRTTFLPPEDQIDLVGERMAKFHGEFLAKHA